MRRTHDHIMRPNKDYRPVKIHQDMSDKNIFAQRWDCIVKGCTEKTLRGIDGYKLYIRGVIL